MATPTEEEPKLNYFQKIWQYRKYLVIEPFFFFYLMASVFNAVAMQNFPLDKACRVNLGYNKLVCDTMLDKSELGIDCDEYSFENTTLGATAELTDLNVKSFAFNYTVCKAEIEAQILAADVSGKRAPIAAIFPLIVLLFAGGWSDRYNKRKPCMMFPVIGEALSFTCLFISAIFFESLPMEFGAYCEAIVPALFGGITFCLMAIYSYITIATPEEDRVFRFGIFAMFITAVPFLGQPVSGFLFQKLGYIFSFGMAVCFQAFALLYIIFFIDEIKPKPARAQVSTSNLQAVSTISQGAENMAYEANRALDDPSSSTSAMANRNVSFEVAPPKKDAGPLPLATLPEVAAKKRSFFREFFDPTLLIDIVRFPLIKRENNGRILLILLMIAYFLTLGPVSGEIDYWYRYTLIKLNWNGNDFSFYLTFTSAATLVGTFIGTAILSKLLKFPDTVIGILSALAIVISRLLFALAENTTAFYVAGVVDMFVSLRVIAIKTIGSSIVDGEELSKMYSIFGISEPIGQFIFPPIFSEIYQRTVESFPGAIFLFGEIFYIPNVIVFIICYLILSRNKKKQKKNVIPVKPSPATPESEVTSL